MTPETKQAANEKLKAAATLIDQAITPICEAACVAVMARQFHWSINMIHQAQQADSARAGVMGAILEVRAATPAAEAK